MYYDITKYFVYFFKVLNLVYVYVAFLKLKKIDHLYKQEL